MFLIDQKGKRIRRICRECRKVHAPLECPKLRESRLTARARRYANRPYFGKAV